MNSDNLQAIAAVTGVTLTLMIAAISAAWIVGGRVRARYDEKRNNAISLFRYYNSEDMMVAREKAWFFLQENRDTRPFRHSELWSSSRLKQESVNSTIRVLAFYYELYSLYNLGRLDKELTARLFSYQFAHWSRQFHELALDTREHDHDWPDVFEPYWSPDLKWLSEGAKIFDPARDSRTGTPADRRGPLPPLT